MRLGILQNVDATESFLFSKILTYNRDKIVETLLVLQVPHLRGELVKIE